MPALTLPCNNDTLDNFVGQHSGREYYRVGDIIYRKESGMGGYKQCFLVYIANPPSEITVTS